MMAELFSRGRVGSYFPGRKLLYLISEQKTCWTERASRVWATNRTELLLPAKGHACCVRQHTKKTPDSEPGSHTHTVKMCPNEFPWFRTVVTEGRQSARWAPRASTTLSAVLTCCDQVQQTALSPHGSGSCDWYPSQSRPVWLFYNFFSYFCPSFPPVTTLYSKS